MPHSNVPPGHVIPPRPRPGFRPPPEGYYHPPYPPPGTVQPPSYNYSGPLYSQPPSQ